MTMDWRYALAALFALAVSYAFLRFASPSDRSVGEQLRSRLILGIPWGTFVAVGFVVFVYLFVQSGWGSLRDPVVIPFQSWSYTYPVGWLTAGFAHSSYGHLLNNLTATLMLGVLAEYAFSHFPQRRGAMSFGSWSTNPYVRAFVIVPVAVVAAGLFTSLFSLGPVIGFSGVVFAFGGFALVRYPIATVVAIFGVSALRRFYDAIQSPTITRGFVETGPSPPWWAEVAIQGHAIGLIAGVLLGIYVFRRRDAVPSPWRIWTGVLLFGIAQSLWAVYWFQGTDQWVLFRGLGFVLVILLALVVTAAAVSSPRPLFRGVTRRQVAVFIVIISLVLMIAPAIGVNMLTTDPGEATDRPGVEVADYRVIYAEGIENKMVAVGDIDIGGLGDVRTSGVIVFSESRNLWTRAVSSSRLASNNQATVTLGGVAWKTTVYVQRPAWSVSGNASVYQVYLEHDGDRVSAFASDPSTADVTVANHTVTLFVEDASFQLRLQHRNETVAEAPIPDDGEAITVGDIEIENRDGTLFLEHDGTSVSVADFSG